MFVAVIAVATSVPAEAYFAATPQASITESVMAQARANNTESRPSQELKTEVSAGGVQVNRDGYGITSIEKLSMAGFSTSSTFTNDPRSEIQWPFAVGVPISDGFGYRSSPGGIGSTNHQGLDMNPGSGAPVQAVADGVVRLAQTSDNGGYGCHVIIDHNVNGMVFASLYGHMQCDSIAVSKGQAVKVTQLVGLVGSTGASTGAHLHFEIHNEKDVPIDPYPWLKQYAS